MLKKLSTHQPGLICEPVSRSVRLPRRQLVRRLGGGIAALFAPALLTGCGPADDRSKEGGGELLVVDTPHPLSFEPSSTGRIYTQMGVAETLIEADVEGKILPGLAESWTVSDDGLEWRFKLRAKAAFHDGTEVTPDLVARSLNRARTRPGVFNFAKVERIEGAGDVLLVKLASRSVLLLPILTNFSTQILAPASFDSSNRAVWVVGTGPYKIKTVTEQELSVEFWSGWSGPEPEITAARYLSAGRAETRGVLAESGQADIVFTLDTATINRLQNRSNLSVRSVPSPRTTFLKVNAGHPFLSDVRARQALSLAIDRAGIAGGLLGSPERAATQLLPPFVREWHSQDVPPLRTDIEAARKLLAELGWAAGSDGILVRNGERFRLNLLTHTVTPELQLIASVVQEQLKGIGIEILVRVTASAEMPTAHNNGTLELAIVNRSYMLVSDPVGALLQDYGRSGGESGAMNWYDQGLVTALEELAAGVDPSRASSLRAQIVRTLQEQLPVIPIVHNPRTAALSSRITNGTVDPLERSYGLAQVRWRQS